ncbi:SGNH/GDSL hydrolase family protein [Microbacterium sp. 20-116]|uniref:SGNH/GDSL hydrolase family protein n=1 Tax=Microbacterium sp. 20-116 TaxID=3239883 RepID=UPI0034E1DB90
MAVVGYFPATLAVDSNTGTRLRNAEAQVFAMTDTSFTTPLAITDVSGVPFTGNKLISNSDGIYPEFKPPAGVTQVIVKSGQALTPMTSIAVAAEAAEKAASDAAGSATDAGAAKADAVKAKDDAVAAQQAAEAVGATTDDQIESRIKDSTSKTSVALTSAFGAAAVAQSPEVTAKISSVGSGLFPPKATVPIAPSTGHLRPYDPALQAYNLRPDNLRKMRAALANARAGANLLRKIVLCGDSTAKGVGSTNTLTKSVHGLLRADLVRAGYTMTGTGLVWAFSGTGGEDPRWTYETGWGPFSEPIMQCNSVNKKATFVSDQPGTVVSIVSLNNNAAATWSYSIDGGAEVTVTPSGAQTVQITNVTGLANTTHTVVIKSLTANATFLCGIEVRGTAGLSLSRLGIGGATAATWNTTTWYSPRKILEAYAPDAFILQLETNDARTGVATPVATYGTRMDEIVAWMLGRGDVALMTGYMVENVDLTPYTEKLYAIADARNVSLFDLTERWGSFATANSLNLQPDALHPGDTGYADAVAGLKAFLGLAA